MKTIAIVLGLLAMYSGMQMLDLDDVLEIWQPVALLAGGALLLLSAAR